MDGRDEGIPWGLNCRAIIAALGSRMGWGPPIWKLKDTFVCGNDFGN